MKRFLNQLIPFIFIGIAIVAFAFGVFLLAYLFLIGAVVGLALFLISWLKEKFFPTKISSPPKKHSGRVIDSNDWKKMP